MPKSHRQLGTAAPRHPGSPCPNPRYVGRAVAALAADPGRGLGVRSP